MKLFRVRLTAYKTFYVEANDEEEALEHSKVDEESNSCFGDIPWDFDEADVYEHHSDSKYASPLFKAEKPERLEEKEPEEEE